jgi:hypothetical protein
MEEEKEAQLEDLLGRYARVFKEPNELPRWMSHNHRIHLKDPNLTFTSKPYRYGYNQRRELKEHIQKYLENRQI